MTHATLAAAAAIVASLWLAPPGTAEIVPPQAVGCKLIKNAAQLQAIRNDLAGSYCLANDIDAGSIANFKPIGDGGDPFFGEFFGNGRVIRNLRIRSESSYVGLFGAVENALIQDVGLVNADITGAGNYAGGLVGVVFASSGTSEIRRVHVTGRVAALGASSYAGGIAGYTFSLTLADSWSSAGVRGNFGAGGAIGLAQAGTFSRVHATGQVACAESCFAGGLMGAVFFATVDLSYASGPVTGGDGGEVGGLAGIAQRSTIRRSYALGAVTTGAGGNAKAGGLIGRMEEGALDEVYALGRVAGGTGATPYGLVGGTAGTTIVTAAYWDVNTSKQAASVAGVGLTTAVLRAALPNGFDNIWAFTAKRSYPFLNDADIAFAAPLATLVKNKKLYIFLPIDQHDTSQYAGASTGANAASLAAVYTMIARAIGTTRKVAKLKDVTIDKYFWNDAAKTTTWQGPVTTRATLGTFTTLAANAPLNDSNVIGAMKSGKLVLLRATYTKGNGNSAKHWLLGTLFTAQGGKLDAVIANDPWTGAQVMIDPASKTVAWPADFPLTNFRIDGYQPVTLN